jgi:hypothetical protein
MVSTGLVTKDGILAVQKTLLAECEACGSRGWLLATVSETGEDCVQRCDDCKVFADDEAARAFVRGIITGRVGVDRLKGRGTGSTPGTNVRTPIGPNFVPGSPPK